MRLASLFVLCAIVLISDAVVVQIIDPFTTSSLLTSRANNGQGPTDPDPVWYGPYYGVDGQGSPPGASGFTNSATILGGQRDVVIGYYSTSTPNTLAAIVNTSPSFMVPAPSMLVAAPLGYVGGVYVQYDGPDAVASGGVYPTFPGSLLNYVPGLGNDAAGVNNAIDWTYAGQVSGLTLEMQTDQLVSYYLDVIDGSGNENHYAFDLEITTSEFRYFGFQDGNWSNPSFAWNDVAAFQVRIWTYAPGQFVVRPGGDGPDTYFYYLNLVGWEIYGDVYQDCTCSGTSTRLAPSRHRLILYNEDQTTEIARVITYSPGKFKFTPAQAVVEPEGVYTICMDLVSTCGAQCQTFTMDNFALPGSVLPSVSLTFRVRTSCPTPSPTRTPYVRPS